MQSGGFKYDNEDENSKQRPFTVCAWTKRKGKRDVKKIHRDKIDNPDV